MKCVNQDGDARYQGRDAAQTPRHGSVGMNYIGPLRANQAPHPGESANILPRPNGSRHLRNPINVVIGFEHIAHVSLARLAYACEERRAVAESRQLPRE